MDRNELLAQFDREMRLDPPVIEGYLVEKVGSVVRLMGLTEHCILHTQAPPSELAHVVAEQVADLRPRGQLVEWKVYSHDPTPELPRFLAAAGFVPKPQETLMVFDLRTEFLPGPAPAAVEFRRIQDEAGFRDLVAVDRAAFEDFDPALYERVRERLHDPRVGIFVAYAHGVPAAGGRVEVERGKSFAGLFGGGTVPEFRRRGIYHHLIRVRAEFARQAGARYLAVEAIDTTSRPILEKVGFLPLAGVEGWVLSPRGPIQKSDSELRASGADVPSVLARPATPETEPSSLDR
jgi:GNAT superfamily N-acetyltransferase